jgi:hypothetical protein
MSRALTQIFKQCSVSADRHYKNFSGTPCITVRNELQYRSHEYRALVEEWRRFLYITADVSLICATVFYQK